MKINLKNRILIAGLITSFAFTFAYQQKANAGTPHFQKIMTVIFENTDYNPTMREDYFAFFASHGALLSNFFGEFHPSQGNYISLITGNNYEVTNDGTTTIDQLSIIDSLEKKGLTWRVYAEGYPGNCYLKDSGKYVRKHNPFISIANIQTNPKRCANIVNASQLAQDIASGEVTNYSFYIPDLNNDGHDTGVHYSNEWFKNNFSAYLQDPKFMQGMAVVATFDEGSYFGGNHIYTAIVGEGIVPGSESNERYDHYSLLKMIEDNFSLDSLGQYDETAPPIAGIWQTP